MLQRLMQLPQVNPNVAVRTVNINRPEATGIDTDSQIAVDMQLADIAVFRYLRSTARVCEQRVDRLSNRLISLFERCLISALSI